MTTFPTRAQLHAALHLVGLQQVELARAANVCETTICLLENGDGERVNARVGTLQRVIEALEGLGVRFVNGGVVKQPTMIGKRFASDAERELMSPI
jgi:predicted transcriptional regulator